MENKKKFLIGVGIGLIIFAGIAFAAVSTLKNNEQAPSESQSEEVSSQSEESSSSEAEESEATGERNIADLDAANELNSDTVAWIEIPNTDISDPILQTANNSDYLRTNEYKESDVWGCYFADYYSNLTAKSNFGQNTVIYGHADDVENANGNRFSQLFRFLDLDFMKANQYIDITLNNGDEAKFEIFGVFYTDVNFYYINPEPSTMGFDEFMSTVNAKNEFVFGNTTVTENDKILTLSTCAHKYDTANTGNHRLVVMGKLVDNMDNSSREITVNASPVRPE